MLIIGIGNEFRCDDALGLIVVRKIKEQLEGVRVVESSGEGSQLLNIWEQESEIIIVDAIKSHKKPGSIYCIDIHKEDLPSDFAPCSTHAFGLKESIEMAKTLQQIPNYFMVYGIEGESFCFGTELSSQVQKSVPQVVENIITNIKLKAKQCTNSHS